MNHSILLENICNCLYYLITTYHNTGTFSLTKMFHCLGFNSKSRSGRLNIQQFLKTWAVKMRLESLFISRKMWVYNFKFKRGSSHMDQNSILSLKVCRGLRQLFYKNGDHAINIKCYLQHQYKEIEIANSTIITLHEIRLPKESNEFSLSKYINAGSRNRSPIYTKATSMVY